MSSDVTQYTNLITSQHADKPKFVATVASACQPFADIGAAHQQACGLFDPDTAVGQQLDVVGQWVGVSRYLSTALSGVYFSFDADGVGFDQGTWLGPFDPVSGQIVLADDAFRTLINARIANNNWDGTTYGAYSLMAKVFPNNTFSIQDYGDLTVLFILTGATVPDAVTLNMFLSGKLNVKPAGVAASYAVPSTWGSPLFGFDVDNSVVGGFDHGSFATITGG